MLKNWLKQIFTRTSKSGAEQPGSLVPPTERMKRVLQMLAMTEDVEYSCEDAYDLLDIYTEMKERGEDTAKLMPLVEFHVKMCGNCREEFEALLKAIRTIETQDS